MWRLVLAIAAALAARPEAPREPAGDPEAIPGRATRELAPSPLDTAPHTGPDPGTPATMDQRKRPKWGW
jgi:hypothetical protein